MRGAPQSGFSRLSRRISSRTFFGTGGRPACPRRTFQVQNRRKLLRCQAMTVVGLTMINGDRQPLHTAHSMTTGALQLPVWAVSRNAGEHQADDEARGSLVATPLAI